MRLKRDCTEERITTKNEIQKHYCLYQRQDSSRDFASFVIISIFLLADLWCFLEYKFDDDRLFLLWNWKKNKSSKCVSRCELGSCRQFCPKINSCLVTWKEAFQRMENLVLRMEGFIALPPKTLTPVLFHFYLYFRETSAIWPVSRGRALIRIRHAAPRRCASPSGIPPPPSPPLPTQVSYLRPEGPLLHSDIILPIYFLVCVRSAVLEL